MFCRRRLQQICSEAQRGGFLPSSSTHGRPLISRSKLKRVTSDAGVRSMSTDGPKDDFSKFGEGSIFSPKSDAWAHIFDDTPSPWSTNQQFKPRRQTMNESEKNVIRNLLDELYHIKQRQNPETLAKAAEIREKMLGERKPKGHWRHTELEKDPRMMNKLDEMKQAIEESPTKVELYQWAQANVFSILALDKPPTANQATPSAEDQHVFQHLLPVLMRHFRDRFHDPNLALFIFKTVRNHSAMSYVLGCTAATYNELMTTLWDSYRDLQGVWTALGEMIRSGIEATSHTRTLAERVCREAMDDKLWLDRTEEGDQVAISTISNISDALVELMAAKSNKQGEWGRRRREVMQRQSGERELTFEERMEEDLLVM